MNAEIIYQKIYASWLGKLIGIRLGAPIEGWSGPEVRSTYAPIQGYVTDYGQFAADDDSNGPLFFVKVMEENSISSVTAKKMGDNLLNVVAPLHGFFWWGSPGIATEHTAWDNLMRGIPAPKSGSAELNTKAIAEQIGGQIFSDCWGYITLGNIEEAVHLSALMSSVTHDLDGIEGGKFVAACIAAAWNETDIKVVIEKALAAIDPNSTYYQTMQEVIAFYEAHPSDPDACIEWLEATHGYDKYPGVCHILPNAAIMLYGMLYGNNDFNQTMGLIADAGCDTDCNLGNVGSIMGMLCGLEGIDEKWIRPMNDILLSSSALGSENITEISSSALYFTRLACALHDLPLPQNMQKTPGLFKADFSMPYAVHGFIPDADRYHACSLLTRDQKLRVCLDDIQPNSPFLIRKKTYFRPEDVYDCRYEPQFAAILEPGDLVRFIVSDPHLVNMKVTPYIKDYNENIFYGETIHEGCVSMRVPSCRVPVLETGLKIEVPVLTRRTAFNIDAFSIEKHPDYELDFSSLSVEDRGLDIGSVRHFTISGLYQHIGQAELTANGLSLKGESALNTGTSENSYTSLALFGEYTEGIDVTFAYCWNGCFDYEGIRIHEHTLSFIQKKNDFTNEIILGEVKPCSDFSLQILRKEKNVLFNGASFPWTLTEKRGAVGLINEAPEDILLSKICFHSEA